MLNLHYCYHTYMYIFIYHIVFFFFMCGKEGEILMIKLINLQYRNIKSHFKDSLYRGHFDLNRGGVKIEENFEFLMHVYAFY